MTTAWSTWTQIGDTGGAGTTGPTGPVGGDSREDPGGRLTLVTGNPIPLADTTGGSAATIYWTPYLSDQLSLYNGTNWVLGVFTEVSLSLTGLTTTQPYDIFAYLDSGILTLQAIAWTNTTTRATTIIQQDGILVANGSPTKRFLGTLQMQATGQCEDSVIRRYVFNQYNRVRRTLRVTEATATWTYNTATFRSANGSASGNRVGIVNGAVSGVAELLVHLTLVAMSQNNTAVVLRQVAIGVDSTNTAHADCVYTAIECGSSDVNSIDTHLAVIDHAPDVGLHFFQWLEISGTTVTTTFTGTGGATSGGVCGLSGHVEI